MTELSNEAQKSILDTKQVLADKEEVLREIGQIEAFEFVNKLATVATLKTLAKIKDQKHYVGLTYTDEKGELATVANWDEFCTHKLNSSKRTIDDRLLNLNTFGEEFYETSQKLGLGSRDLRKLRQLPDDQQKLVIDDDALDLTDKDVVKEKIEELTDQFNAKENTLKKELIEAQRTAKARQKVAESSNKALEDLHKKLESLENNQKAPTDDWKKQVQEINLIGTKLAAMAIECVDKLANLNERINTEQLDPEFSLLAIQQLAQVQVHCVDQVFLQVTRLHMDTREVFASYVNDSHAMYSENELIALEQEIMTKGQGK